MNIVVLGAGAIGSLYGAKLSTEPDVTLIGRRKHVDAIKAKGLRVAGIEQKTYHLSAATELSDIKANTLVILATKLHDSEAAILPLRELVRKDTTILCLQNGLEPERIVKKTIKGRCRVLRGITTFGAVFLKPGEVQYHNDGYTLIEQSHEIADMFTHCGLNAHVSDDIRKDSWNKFIMNCMLNAPTAILRIENGRMADPALDPLKQNIARECLQVAKKKGVTFERDFVARLNEGVKDSTNLSSMYQDLLKGKRTEIDYLNGAVVELGKKHGIACPVNEALVSIISYIFSQSTVLL